MSNNTINVRSTENILLYTTLSYIKSNILCQILSLIYYWHIQINMLYKGEIKRLNKVAQSVANTKVEGPKKPKN